jgi:hypothetical protein
MHVFGTTAKIGIFFALFPFFNVYFAFSFVFFRYLCNRKQTTIDLDKNYYGAK